ncbi:hypothetical protein P8907_19990 [Bacillus atrophaeus]|uniref:hypothetical protein n=1 Tax=Bacillus atrophaeus TaxID=1452 RepID=UPI00228132AA|nr:hypothetical protein [Bacillus atrophaeus]MCY8810704.1 hypothetical protein [Bacillus atrophaeus]MCY8907856.1 hypothetical protein [Bacillus atrophaeus]MEC0837862.1 hypothetical protein [Bacillus atrophaeus]MEC0847763.1 hypothetical protein [Bacillus atrophaeus]MEC0849982.1 hypothetical protein [Bacillus atrophaeus]
MERIKQTVPNSLKTTEGRVLIAKILIFERLAGSLFKQINSVDFMGTSIFGMVSGISFISPILIVSVVLTKVCKNIIEKPDPTY